MKTPFSKLTPLILLLALTGCGQSGPLYLPEQHPPATKIKPPEIKAVDNPSHDLVQRKKAELTHQALIHGST